MMPYCLFYPFCLYLLSTYQILIHFCFGRTGWPYLKFVSLCAMGQPAGFWQYSSAPVL